jgi:hypothetical protein
MPSFVTVSNVLALFLWAFPPIAGAMCYRKLVCVGNPPQIRTGKELAIASVGAFFCCLVFLACAVPMSAFLGSASVSEYFGLAFPKPWGTFVALAAAFAVMGLLLALHAATRYFTRAP